MEHVVAFMIMCGVWGLILRALNWAFRAARIHDPVNHLILYFFACALLLFPMAVLFAVITKVLG